MSKQKQRLKALGLDQKELKQEITVMDEETITDRIDKLQEMTLNQFNKLILHKPETVIDKKIVIVSTEECSKDEECKNIHIEFNLLFNYEIGGFKTDRFFHTVENKEGKSSRLWVEDRILRRKGGLFHLNVVYYHHTTFCGGSYLGSTIKRTPFSLMIPSYGNFESRGLTTVDTVDFFHKLVDIQNTVEPSLDTVDEIIKEFAIEGEEHDHTDEICSDYNDGGCNEEYCDYAHYANEEQYCDSNCGQNSRPYNLLSLMLTHPHFFGSMDNFCTGGQFTSNPVLLEMQKFPNPITYIAQMIRLTNDVYLADSYNRDRYMVDVFDNFDAFNSYDRGLARLREHSSYYFNNSSNKENSVHSSEDHCLTPDCYCIDCVIFRFWLVNGLKYDPSKLIFGETVEIDKDHYLQCVTHHYRGNNIGIEDYNNLTDLVEITIDNKVYHIKDKSPFNQLNSGFQSSDFQIGLFRNIRTNQIKILRKSNIDLEYTSFSNLSKMKDQFRNISTDIFTMEELESVEKIFEIVGNEFDKIPIKTKMEFLLGLYEPLTYE